MPPVKIVDLNVPGRLFSLTLVQVGFFFTKLIYAMADMRSLEEAVESFGELASSGYKMVTKLPGENEKPLIGT